MNEILTINTSIEFNSHSYMGVPGHRVNSEVSSIERPGKLVLNDNVSVVISWENLQARFVLTRKQPHISSTTISTNKPIAVDFV